MTAGLAHAAQSAVFTALSGSSALDALLARHMDDATRPGIYAPAPQPDDAGNNALFPYITLGEDTLNDWSTDTSSGADVVVHVHIWSRKRSWLEPKQIAAAVYSALHRQPLSTPAHDFVDCHFDGEQIIRDDDGITLHIQADYRMLLEASD